MFQGYVGKFLEPPKNGWLEYDTFLLGQKGLFFKGENVSFRAATTGMILQAGISLVYHQETQLHRPLIHPIHR